MKIIITESQLNNLLLEYEVMPFQQTNEVGSRIDYNFHVGDIEYVVSLVGTEDKQLYELGFGVVGQNEDSYRTGKDIRHLNTVLYTVDAIVKEAVAKYRIKTIVFSGARGEGDSHIPFFDPVRLKIYFRFLTQKYPNAKYQKDRMGNLVVFMNSIYPEVFEKNKDKKEIFLDLLDKMNNGEYAEDDYWRWDRSIEFDVRGHLQGYSDAIDNAEYGPVYIEVNHSGYGYILRINLYDVGEEIEENFDKFGQMVNYIKNKFKID